MVNEFKAMVVKELENGDFKREILTKNIKDLPNGEVLINVKYSSLNYKDALSSIGNKGVTKKYPHTPGIDAAGIVVESKSDRFKKGDQVIVTGYDLGMNTDGGFAEYISVPANWIVSLPKNLSLKESMIFGTAGFTAALSVDKLMKNGVRPEDGDILVTGATGGVGSTAIMILNKLGYSVIGVTGRPDLKEKLISLGAKDIILRNEVDDDSGKLILKEKWAGVIDTVGGNILATAIKSTKYKGSVTCCGNVASHELNINVYPFILRGVSLLGVDSVECPIEEKENIWKKLSEVWKPFEIDKNIEEVGLDDLSNKIDQMLEGKLKNRIVLNLEI
ncbi:MAG: YhdH/YhfP family quinone oxidoreductase [Peptoniphilaceae bacterium]